MPLDDQSLPREMVKELAPSLRNRQMTLRDVLQKLNVTPIPRSILDAHKAAEVKKHSGNWFASHPNLAQGLINATALISLFGTFFFAVLAIVFVAYDATGTLAMCVDGAFIVFFAIFATVIALFHQNHFLKLPAQWHESHYCPSVPGSIISLARRINSMTPNSVMVFGILKQEEVVLDPYVLIRTPTEEAIIGIWDGSKIIHIARRE